MYLKGLIEYLILGVIVDIVFDLITKRIRSRFSSRVMMLQTQTGFGHKTCIVLVVFGLVALWPAVILGAITNYGGAKE